MGAEPIQLVSDVCHYDMYLLCNQVFGGAFNLPGLVNPVCYDICQDLSGYNANDSWLQKMIDAGHRPTYSYPIADSDSMELAFNTSRELWCQAFNDGKLPEGAKHNALYDAEVIKMIYEGIRR